MQTTSAFRLSSMIVAALLVTATHAVAQNYPLELTNIKPAGTGLGASNRIYRAYPGLEYNIRAAVIGGVYPYTFSLGSAPSGMTINAATGQISWTNPQANASPTITVRDSVGAQVSATWGISVTTAGFVFINGASGRNASNNGCSASCGTGTIANPWRTIRDMVLSGQGGAIAYFRNGTYDILDLPRVSAGGVWDRVEIDQSQSPVAWIAYPGDSPVIDFAYQPGGASVPFIRLTGDSIYVDGFETTRARIMAFQVTHENNRGSTFRRNNMHDLILGGDGTNAAFIMVTTQPPNAAYGMVVQDNRFSDLNRGTSNNVALKFYSVIKLLVENNIHQNGATATELKADCRQFTVRGDIYSNFADTAIGGNMHGIVGGGSGGSDLPTSGGEILFNTVLSTPTAVDLNQDGQAVRIDVYRNTFVGRAMVRNVTSEDGPFYLSNNVIVNSDSGTPAGSHVHHVSVSAPSRVILSNNLVGSPGDNIVDSAGNLTPAYAQYIGSRGAQTGPSHTLPIPAAPSNVRVIR